MSKRKIKKTENQAAEKIINDFVDFADFYDDPDGIEVATLYWGDGGYSMGTRRLSPDEHAAMTLYIQAHRFLPPNYVYEETAEQIARVCHEAAQLRNPSVTFNEVERAVILLAHSPSEISLSALGKFSNSDHPLAVLADFGLDECLQFSDPKMSPVVTV